MLVGIAKTLAMWTLLANAYHLAVALTRFLEARRAYRGHPPVEFPWA